MRISDKDKVDIINAYQNNLEPMISIAARYCVNRARIYQILRAMGVDTSKRKLEVSCAACGKTILRPKCQVRTRKNHFCGYDCYGAFISQPTSAMWRHGQRIARSLVAGLIELEARNVVHHADGNNHNNNLENLVVFKTQGDHIRHHRGFEVEPIWVGSSHK